MDTAVAALPVLPPPAQAPSSAAPSSAASSSSEAKPPAPGTDSAGNDAAGTFAGALEQQLTHGAASAARTPDASALKAAAPDDKRDPHDNAGNATPDALVALLAGTPMPPPAALPQPPRVSDAPSAALQGMVGGGRDGNGRAQLATHENGPLPLAADGKNPPDAIAAGSAGETHEPAQPLSAASAGLLVAHASAAGPAAAPTAAALPPLASMHTQSAAPLLTPAPVLAPAPMPTAHITSPVGSAAWGDAVAQHVTFMVKEGEHTAQLRLNPPDLGPLEVRVSVTSGTDSVANAQFASPHAAVREALQAALPQLRTALADSGITLANAWVGHGFAQHDPRQPQPGSGGSSGAGGNAVAPNDATPGAVRPVSATIARRGLVDTFA